MPKASKVHKMADAIERRGVSKGRAIAIAQSKMKQSYATGKPLKKSGRKR